jgi:hypothetical protein
LRLRLLGLSVGNSARAAPHAQISVSRPGAES